MGVVKEFLRALYCMLLFKPYTTMPRYMEISYGIISWYCVGLLTYINFLN